MALLLRLPSRHLPPHHLGFTRALKHGITRSQSTQASSPAASTSRTTTALVGLGGSALVASYFFWPDPSRAAPTKTSALLSPSYFTPVVVASTELCIDPSTRLMTLTVPRQSVPKLQEAAFDPVWSIFIKDDDIQVERPFTPLEGIDSDGRMRFWVKKYEKGEVGRWLHSKRAGDIIEIRGPLKTWPWQDNTWDEVIMISGGTGITPFYQLIHKELLNQPTTNTTTRFTLLHSSRTPAELPPPEMLDPLIAYSQANPGRLKLSLFVDTPNGPSHPSLPSASLSVGRIGKEAVERATGSGQQSWWRRVLGTPAKGGSQEREGGKAVMFLVCGPDPMVAAIAGPHGRNFSQGEVGGVLGELGYERDSVWKL